MFYIALDMENKKKIFFSETRKPRTLIFVMLHHLVELFQVCSNYDPGAQNGPARGHMFRRGPSRENMKKPTCLKPQGLEP